MSKIRQRDVRAVNVAGGNASPFVLTIRTYRSGTTSIELLDYQLETLAEAIAERLTQRRNEMIRLVTSLSTRIASATAKGA